MEIVAVKIPEPKKENSKSEKKSETKSFMDVMSNIQQSPEVISENPIVVNNNKKITDDVLAEIFAMIGVDQNFNLDNFVVENENTSPSEFVGDLDLNKQVDLSSLFSQNDVQQLYDILNQNEVSPIKFEEILKTLNIIDLKEVVSYKNLNLLTEPEKLSVSGKQVLNNIDFKFANFVDEKTSLNEVSQKEFNLNSDVKVDYEVLKNVSTGENNFSKEEIEYYKAIRNVKSIISEKENVNENEETNNFQISNKNVENTIQFSSEKLSEKDIEHLENKTVEMIEQNIKLGKEEFSIKLRPAGLGEILVKMSKLENGEMSISLSFSSEKTMQLLNGEFLNLENSLKALNATLNSFNVEKTPDQSNYKGYEEQSENQNSESEKQKEDQNHKKVFNLEEYIDGKSEEWFELDM